MGNGIPKEDKRVLDDLADEIVDDFFDSFSEEEATMFCPSFETLGPQLAEAVFEARATNPSGEIVSETESKRDYFAKRVTYYMGLRC